ncbi:hypothetical protein EDF60_1597 [Leucobacter luti]|uniref:hypothetical protein n=1 Tax=Leucobacter luti TaxID=340320 RepID=UPI00104A2D16|nr:hypothetical protein [Leucobacter luti]MCW2286951.1 hypothetical protein [Leucobacter luti]TCK41178.1 hypothetical protein EDF60_1597 [Leucobacter luti]
MNTRKTVGLVLGMGLVLSGLGVASPASALGYSMARCSNGLNSGSVEGQTSSNGGFSVSSTFGACGRVGISVVYGTKSRFQTSWNWKRDLAVASVNRISKGFHRAENSNQFTT